MISKYIGQKTTEDKLHEEALRDTERAIRALEKLMLDYKRLVDKYGKKAGGKQ